MSYLTAVEVGRLYKPLSQLAGRSRSVYDSFVYLPGLRGYWPMSGSNTDGDATDFGGLFQPLSGLGDPIYGEVNGVGYVKMDGASRLVRPDNLLWDITGTEAHIDPVMRGLTLGAWARFDADQQSALISKYDPSLNQRAYLLQRNAADNMSFVISSDGAAMAFISDTVTLSTGQWYFLVGRFTPSTELAAFVNGAKYTLDTGIPASIFNSTAQLEVGGNTGSSIYLDGKMAHVFICAMSLSDSIIDNLYQATRDFLIA